MVVSRFRFFHSEKHCVENNENEKKCLGRIKNAVSEKTGISNFIEYDDFTIAFAGTKENMELMLEVCTMKSGKEEYLYASVDDEASWQAWDYESLAEFESDIVDYISNRVNKTIKTIVEADNKYRISSYYLENNGEWVCFENESSDSKLINFIASKLAETGETVKTYKLQNDES